jgi:hypothetical protein
MTEPDYYPLTMAAEKTGYTEVHLISLAADDKLQLYVRPCGVNVIEVTWNNDPYDANIEELYLHGTYKIPARTFQRFLNDRLAILDILTPLEGEGNLCYNVKTPVLMKEIALLVSAGDVARLSKKETVKTTISETERSTMLKLILGMAMDAYGYVPESTRNIATGDNKGSITAGLQTRGISINADTIRKYLTQAKDLI